jgi:hypothetical protein
MQRVGISYDIDGGKYSFQNLRGRGREAAACAMLFQNQSSDLTNALDNWEMAIRTSMKRMGLLFVKDRGLKDGIRDTS